MEKKQWLRGIAVSGIMGALGFALMMLLDVALA